jgi:ribulose 1,5-bisphosphate carboxylase large subunit-like protein
MVTATHIKFVFIVSDHWILATMVPVGVVESIGNDDTVWSCPGMIGHPDGSSRHRFFISGVSGIEL